ncbi:MULTISPECIES: DMT family transporter [unclassified Lentimicrobium]|uniref:DMT family transporter n=1 Tax=unclassified Lentimicrobium TaxID=2677434 RepID=UPI001555A7F4|nr:MULTISPECIES: DMT family transporter [unclassified Lentimicrobium]NPD45597.1 DMT family transporter [Lentimicrobium sp. S6]NPD86316.1 DMT family transporter [Lentimicrobium sp. L6]
MKNFLLVLVAIVWGSTFFIIKDTVASVHPFYIVLGRMLMASIPMLLFVFFKNRKSLWNKKAIINGSILGLLLTTTYISQTIGLQYTSSGHSAFITGIAVVLVPILLVLIYRQKIKNPEVVSILIVMIGLFLLTYDLDTHFNKGDLITLITSFSLAFHIILSGRFVKTTDSLSLITYQFVSGSVICAIGSFFVAYHSGFEGVIMSSESLMAIMYLGAFGTLFCYFVSVWVQKYESSVKVALIFSLEPVFAALFAFIFVNEVLSFKEIIGTIFILLGVLMYQVLKSRTATKIFG